MKARTSCLRSNIRQSNGYPLWGLIHIRRPDSDVKVFLSFPAMSMISATWGGCGTLYGENMGAFITNILKGSFML